jgi:exonuclease SbcC
LILDRMTDGQMKVELETQKEKKTGGSKESLEIKITDKLGPRPYELFSGGEAFRINFAIRVALSQLLSQRANAKLQFLVIDEGFGGLDKLGRESLIEAINAVRKDFSKILVVSHLAEIKDAFPARIEVTKDEEGSHLELKE